MADRFFIDGINFNSRIDPGITLRNDDRETAGVAQAFTVNSRLVEDVTLYDSNIPVEFGAFSGGVVDIRTRSPKDFAGSTFGFEYRTSADSLGDYHLIEENLDRRDDLSGKIPNYAIKDVGFYSVYKINSNHSVLIDGSYTESQIDVLSLNQYVDTYRENLNLLLKYTATDLGFDRQDFSLTYAPYENDSLLTHVLGSRQSVEQGGYAAQWRYRFTGNPADSGKFRTPSLRAVGKTGPWMHNGNMQNLRAVMAFYNVGGPQPKKPEQHPNLHLWPKHSPLLKNLALSRSEMDAVIAFMQVL